MKKKDKLIAYIESRDWVDWSCGRSTDYCDEFWEEGSIKNLKEKVEELYA